MCSKPQGPGLARCVWPATNGQPNMPLYCIEDNQTILAVTATQPHCALNHVAGKMTVSPVKQERSIAGWSSKSCHLQQANRHHIKRSDLTDGGKKLSLTGKLKLLDQHEQGVTDFIYLYLSCYVHVYKHSHIYISLLKSCEKIKQSCLWKNKACFLGL